MGAIITSPTIRFIGTFSVHRLMFAAFLGVATLSFLLWLTQISPTTNSPTTSLPTIVAYVPDTSCGFGNVKIDEICALIREAKELESYFGPSAINHTATQQQPQEFTLLPSTIAAQKEVVESINEHNVDINLPARGIPLPHHMSYYEIGSNGLFETLIFAFRKKARRIALHNHPDLYGFIKAVRGSMAITSYSWLSSHEEGVLLESSGMIEKSGTTTDSNTVSHCPARRPVRYEDRIVLTAGSDDDGEGDEAAVLTFDPVNYNLHFVDALEDGSAFFALHLFRPDLAPEDDPGNFFALVDEGSGLSSSPSSSHGSTKPSTRGDIHWIEVIDDPRYMVELMKELD